MRIYRNELELLRASVFIQLNGLRDWMLDDARQPGIGLMFINSAEGTIDSIQQLLKTVKKEIDSMNQDS